MGSSRHTQDRYVREAHTGPTIVMNQIEEQPNKVTRRECEDVTFTKRDARWVHHPHHDALVIMGKVRNNNVQRLLVDNGSVKNILYLNACNRIGLAQEYLKLVITPLYRFTRDSLIPQG